jgi:16S rRNA (guanine527-N7)-methyltransferase
LNLLWNELAARGAVELTPRQHELFTRYLDLLEAGNRRMNLTRIVDRESAEIQHIADALTLLKYLPPVRIESNPGEGKAARISKVRLADVGSGSGVPGVVLAIARPDVQILLLESTKKKAVFLEETARELALENVRVSDQRAEDAGRLPELREKFDVAAARAVGTLNWLAEWCLPLVKKGGRMLAMKGPKAAEELPLAGHAIRLVGGGNVDVHPADLPGGLRHVIVEIRKIAATPSSYPRSATSTGGKPL